MTTGRSPTTTRPITGEALRQAQRLGEALQATGKLTAERYGNELLVNTHYGNGHLAERIACRPDGAGVLRWHWSWGKPITGPDDNEPLTVDDLPALVERVGKVIGLVKTNP